jgi:membrane peptidoglycan carboxypeptidase
VLGVAGVSPLEMAGAYATFAARGKHCDNRPVTQILNSDGKVFKNYPKNCRQVVQESTADTVNSILAGVLAPGGFGQALALDKPAAGKTGTINSNMAVWFNGYTPALATAAMIAGANSQGQPITLNGKRVGGRTIGEAFGSTVAGPMWSQAMRAVQDDLPDEDFATPSRSPGEGAIEIEVPDVTGLSTRRAAQRLAGAGFYVDMGEQRSSDAPVGTVAETRPGSGHMTARGSTVTIYPSAG